MIRVGLILTLIAPLMYSGSFLFPFIVPRATFFQIVISITFAVAVLFVIFFPRFRPRFSSVSRGLAIFFLAALITTITSADPSKSFMGTIERSFGFFNIIHFFALYFAAIVGLRTNKDWNIFLGISVFICTYAGIAFLIPLFSGLTAGQVPVSIAGNPSFFSGYLLFHLFFAAVLFSHTNNKWVRLLLGIVMAFLAYCVLISGVRAGFLGLAAGVLYLLAYAAYAVPRVRVMFISTALLLIFLYALIFVNRNQAFVYDNSILRRITNFSLQEETTRARFAMWKIAFSGFQEKPIVGWGRENYSLVFNVHYDKSFEAAHVAESWEDRSHNVIFDELVNGGLIELSAYLFLLGAVFFLMRKKPFVSAVLVSYFVQNLFGVDTLNTYLPFFIFLAYAYFLHESEKPQHAESVHQRIRIPAAVPATFVIVFVAAGIYLSLRLAFGNIYMSNALNGGLFSDNYDFFKTQYEKSKNSLAVAPAMRAEALTILASVHLQNIPALSQRKDYITFAAPILADLEESANRNTSEQRFSLVLTQMLMYTGLIMHDSTYLDKADAVAARLIAASPERSPFKQLVVLGQKSREELAKKADK